MLTSISPKPSWNQTSANHSLEKPVIFYIDRISVSECNIISRVMEALLSKEILPYSLILSSDSTMGMVLNNRAS